MQQSRVAKNAQTLERELYWLAQVIDTRFKLYFNMECEHESIFALDPPPMNEDPSVYARVVRHFQMTFQERIVLILSLVPHIRPQVLDIFFTKNDNYDRIYTEFGGLKGKYHSGFLPTGETASFILAGNSIAERINILEMFRPEHFFARHNILKLDLHRGSEPVLSSGLQISEEYLMMLTRGTAYKPDFSTSFPAKLLSTRQDWADLVLDPHVLGEISEIAGWVKHQDTIMNEWGLSRMLKRGYRALFYGPPGTGKTLTACLLGKTLNLDVYRVDLSQVVSKYIGETEKNMANIFDQAENKNWILFFDEADALFGKRTGTSDSKDRHANQEVAYLLQRVEDYSGIIILATNLKANMDIAFTRRFQSIIYFPAPNYEQRLKLWRNTFEGNMKLSNDVDFEHLASEYKITGGSIINILRYCSLSALERGSNAVAMEDIEEGIKKEMRKEGKTMY
jgi:hypothetical protein